MSVNIKQNGDLVKVANNISIVQANWNDRGNTSKSTCIRNQPATLKSLDEISANTDTNALAGASAVKELNDGLETKTYLKTRNLENNISFDWVVESEGNAFLYIYIEDALVAKIPQNTGL